MGYMFAAHRAKQTTLIPNKRNMQGASRLHVLEKKNKKPENAENAHHNAFSAHNSIIDSALQSRIDSNFHSCRPIDSSPCVSAINAWSCHAFSFHPLPEKSIQLSVHVFERFAFVNEEVFH